MAGPVPGGIWPLARWTRFTEFVAAQGVAAGQGPRDGLMPELTETEVEERLLVIGADGTRALTLLDLSSSFFKRTPYLARADHDAAGDAYRLTVAPISLDHYTDGVLLVLTAPAREL